MTLRNSFTFLKRTIGIFFEMLFAFITVYWLCYAVLSRISGTPSHYFDSSHDYNETIEVIVNSNGVHTDFIVPIHTTYFNWEKALNLEKELLVDTFQTHLSIGWGDKNFYLNTKEWSDLSVGTAMKAMLGLGEGAHHLILCCPKDLDKSEFIYLKLTPKQYKQLCGFISGSFDRKNGKTIKIENHPYGSFHFFYESKFSYSMLYTCNCWTNSGLQAAEMPNAFWTPFRGGIYSQYGR